MSNITYALPEQGKVMSHGGDWLLMFRDGYSPDEKLELMAQVRSGDYLMMLATALDSLSYTLTSGNDPEAAILQKHVENLLYLDKEYKLVKK